MLDARNAGVTDLSGLAHAINLEGLDLGHSAVVDLRPLSSLPSLRRLSLDGSAPELWELAALRGLRELSCGTTAWTMFRRCRRCEVCLCWTWPTTGSTT